MLKLIRYLKRYIPIILLGLAVLIGQAAMDLSLPNMMSNIVNVGIQKNGIEEVAPRAIDPQSFSMLLTFMSEDDQQVVQAAYTPYSELSQKQQENIAKTFPQAAEANAMVLTAEGDARTAADSAFARGGYAFYTALQAMAKQAGIELGTSDETSAEFNTEMLSKLLPLLAQMPDEQRQEIIRQAGATPETMTTGVAAVFNKAFYSTLGADLDAMQTGYIIRTGLKMLGFSLGLMICSILAGFCFSRTGAGVARDLRRDVFAKVMSFSNNEMDKFSTASLITRTTNDISQIQTLYSMAMRILFYAPIIGIGGVFMALRRSVQMSWIIAVAVVIVVIAIFIVFRVVMPKFERMQSLVDRVNQVSREGLSGIMVIRAFGNQEYQGKRFDKANHDLTQNSLSVGRTMVLLMPLMTVLMNLVTLAIVRVGSEQIAASTMQVGDMMAFLQYAMQIIMSFLMIAMIFIMVPRASVSADRVNEVLLSENDVKDPAQPKTLGGRAKGVVEFQDVSFRYAGADEDVLSNISFTAKPGETTAIIGATGAGKTTLVNLIPRFYDVSSGSVTLDGEDVRTLSQDELRDNIGYVPQKGLLFSGDINSNLRYGDPNATDEQVREAAEIAQATDFIDNMGNGFASPISQGGTNVSGGQRQRLSIARALVKDAPVYIFDDSFSALDFATDARLREALAPYTRQSAVFIVAQRVSSIMHAEQILVMDDGKIVGKGTHRELLKNCDTYREIAESQLSKEELA